MAVENQPLRPKEALARISASRGRICLPSSLVCEHKHPTVCWPIFLRPSIAHTNKYWTINQFPIDYAFPPRLRGRLTLGRLPLPRKPWVCGERVSHPFYRYLCQHNHFSTVQPALQLDLLPLENAPLPSTKKIADPKLRRHA